MQNQNQNEAVNDALGYSVLSIMIAIAVVFAIAFLVGCTSLKDKTVAFAGTVSAIKIETSGSSSTGTPTPNIMVGGAAMAFADKPKGDNSPVFVRAARKSFISQLFSLGTDDCVVIYMGTRDEKPEDTVARIQAFQDDVKVK